MHVVQSISVRVVICAPFAIIYMGGELGLLRVARNRAEAMAAAALVALVRCCVFRAGSRENGRRSRRPRAARPAG